MNNRKMYLQGLLDAESRYKATEDINDLKDWVKYECQIVADDHRWNEWQLGAKDYIIYAETILN